MARTLEIYGSLRAAGVEHFSPLPKLLQVEVVDTKTTLALEYVGQDCAHFCPMNTKAWRRLREEATAELEALGLGARVSHHKTNWALAKKGAAWRAILLDLGRCFWKGLP